jgi:thiol-disulfide isomerase/thioredoxin
MKITPPIGIAGRAAALAAALALALASPATSADAGRPPGCCSGPPGTSAAADGPDSGVEMLGLPAPPFEFARWLRTEPLTPESLRGKVVLVRFWTDDCRFCENTLPAIEGLRERWADRGLVVLGAYHPHEPRPVTDAFVLKWARKHGFGGPIGVDEHWDTLERWWLDGHPERNWVSVSFLLDRQGRVRWIHGGGEYHPSGEVRHRACDKRWRELEQVIQSLLDEGDPQL